MRFDGVLSTDAFPVAELAAMRLDGDCFDLGDGMVAGDQPITTVARATSIAPAARRYRLVATTWTAAWVHGAVWSMPHPHRFAVDVLGSERTRLAGRVREMWFQPGDLMITGGLRLTTPLRTALDLARMEQNVTASLRGVLALLLEQSDCSPVDAAARLTSAGALAFKRRAVERLLGLATATAVSRL